MKPWSYLDELNFALDAPPADNQSGLYCPDCRACGMSHCSEVEYCGGMKPMKPAAQPEAAHERCHAASLRNDGECYWESCPLRNEAGQWTGGRQCCPLAKEADHDD